MAAIALAWDQHADAVEVDVHLSKDGQLVVIHDYNTRKTGGRRRDVNNQTLAELQELDAGRWKGKKWVGETIPTLAEVLASLPQAKRLFIEIKCGMEGVPELENVLRRSGKRLDQIIAIGFALETMRQIKWNLPAIEVCWIAEFKRDWKTGGWLPRPATLIKKTRDAGLDGLDLGARGPITPGLVKQIKKADLKLYVWTVDSPSQARKLRAAGVEGVTTNRPGWLREKLLAWPKD